MTLGPTDVIGRTGGEEFLAILPATPLPVAQTIAERLRSAVERLDFSDLDSNLHVTISVGLTEWTSSDDVLTKIARRADELLYRAKEGGRNRVEVAAA